MCAAVCPSLKRSADTPKFFNDVFVQTLRAGEASGQFGPVAERLADYQELEVSRRGQITSALVYPALLSLTSLGVVIFLITFVLPKMAGVFNGLGSDLPTSTAILMALSTFLTHNWIAVVVVIVVAIVGVMQWFKTDSGALARDRFSLRAPLIGTVMQKPPSPASPGCSAPWSTAGCPSWKP